MGLAVNSCTLGMAVAGLGIALTGARIEPRLGITVSLALWAIPTVLLAFAGDLLTFAALRVVQGMFMAVAFSLTLAHLSNSLCPRQAASAVAAYIAGNVASNLVGRMLASAVAGHAGLASAFFAFALLNLAGAVLAYITITGMKLMPDRCPEHSTTGPDNGMAPMAVMSEWRTHLQDPALRAAFVIGFAILFVFIGTFTYVGFVLRAPPLSLAMMSTSLVYLVFLPSILTTPFAGRLGVALGIRNALWLSLAVAAIGLPLLVSGSLTVVMAGLTLIAIGTFAAQAIATGYVGRRAETGRASASGMYLASYYLGGLAGTAVLGVVFDSAGWPATVAGIAIAIAIAAALSFVITDRPRRTA